MKRFILLLFFGCFGSSLMFGQLTVKPSNSEDFYVYVKGTSLFVKDDINLEENTDSDLANIYLREEAQLLQGRTDASTNTGNGTISLYQEGTSNATKYNYWSSPIGQASGAAGNTAFGITLLQQPQDKTTSIPASTTTDLDGSADPLTISKVFIYKFVNAASGDWIGWTYVGDATNINAGEGFSMKGTDGTDATTINGVENNAGSAQRYDFRGRPNDGLISVDVAGNDELVLVGNPYPSALNFNYFLLENTGTGNVPTDCTGGATIPQRNATTGAAYFWDSDPSVHSHSIFNYKGGYATYTSGGSCSSMGMSTPPTYYMYNADGSTVGTGEEPSEYSQYRRYLPIGQGFFMQGAETGTVVPIQFKNTHRVFVKEGIGNNSVFERSANSGNPDESFVNDGLYVIPKIRINFAFDDEFTRQIALGFQDNASKEVEAARDAQNLDDYETDAGFLHNGENYVIDVRKFNLEDKIPLYLKLNEQRNLSIHVNNFENFTETDKIYIHDKLNNIYALISGDNYYYLNLDAGDYSNRYELTFQNGQDTFDTTKLDESNFVVFQNNASNQLEIKNPNNISIKSISMYDMTGKLLLNQTNLPTKTNYTFTTQHLAEAVYLVNITTKANKSITKKINVIHRY